MPHVYTNGISTYFEDSAHAGASGPAVVLIHGHSVDLRMWDEQVPALRAAGYRVIRYDVRGHGRSMAPPGGYTWESYSVDLRDLLDRINLEAAHMVGLSMGGGIAIQFALDFPMRVLSLTLVDSALPGFPYSDEFSGRIEALVAAVRSEGPGAAFQRLWLADPLFDGIRRFPDRFQRLHEMVSGFPAVDYREEAVNESYVPDVIGRLGEITASALVITGENDIPDFHLVANVLAEGLPSARKLVLTDCGHLPPMERPQAFNEALLSFLREQPDAPAAP